LKRDMNLIRQILLVVEGKSNQALEDLTKTHQFSGNEPNSVTYHVKLLNQAGLLEGMCIPHFSAENSSTWLVESLTWAGHEFLDAARDETVWKKITKSIGTELKSVSFDILISLLKNEARTRLGLPV
jgi:Hypothetical protein (DUF2513)